MTPVLCLESILLRRSGREILRDISWTYERGQHWALLGANGSGKTTLLKVVTGYEWPTQGRVEVLGERFGECNLPALRKRIGWVSSMLEHRFPPESRALDVVLSGLEASIGLFREFTESETLRARQALEAVNALAHAEQRHAILSQGEQQRVLLARALVSQPELLILDEPCAGLDPAAREHFLDDLDAFARREQAPAMILVTHHIEEISPAFTHALVLKEGQVLAQGPSRQVITSHILGEALDRPCQIEQAEGRFWLRIRGGNPA